jgi:anti-sigma factor RsiW
MKMIRHRAWKIMISRNLDGDLDDGGRRRLENHLLSCRTCRETYRDYRTMRSLVRSGIGDTCVRAREDDATPVTGAGISRRALSLKVRPRVLALAASILLVIVVASMLFLVPFRTDETGYPLTTQLDKPLERYFYYVEERFSETTLTGMDEPMGAYFEITVADAR